jgi:Glycine cleavage H-protein
MGERLSVRQRSDHHLSHETLTVHCTAKRYTKEHEVISYDDATSIGRLHITEYASKSLGDVVFVELPKKGREVEEGGEYNPESLLLIIERLNPNK